MIDMFTSCMHDTNTGAISHLNHQLVKHMVMVLGSMSIKKGHICDMYSYLYTHLLCYYAVEPHIMVTKATQVSVIRGENLSLINPLMMIDVKDMRRPREVPDPCVYTSLS